MDTHYGRLDIAEVRKGLLQSVRASERQSVGSRLVVDRVKWEKYDGRSYPIFLSVQERHVLNIDRLWNLQILNLQRGTLRLGHRRTANGILCRQSLLCLQLCLYFELLKRYRQTFVTPASGVCTVHVSSAADS
jgi:hypothetical protein